MNRMKLLRVEVVKKTTGVVLIDVPDDFRAGEIARETNSEAIRSALNDQEEVWCISELSLEIVDIEICTGNQEQAIRKLCKITDVSNLLDKSATESRLVGTHADDIVIQGHQPGRIPFRFR